MKRYKRDPKFREMKKLVANKWYYEHREEALRSMRERYAKNRETVKIKQRKWRRDNTRLVRDHYLRKNYGISISDYDALFVKQNGLCELCGLAEKDTKLLSVDHCHTTGKVRSLLCSSCNGGLGLFDDDESLLQKAIAYLKFHKEREDIE